MRDDLFRQVYGEIVEDENGVQTVEGRLSDAVSRKLALEELIADNMEGVNPSQEIFHFIELKNLLSCMKRGGLRLSIPSDWSVYEDYLFQNGKKSHFSKNGKTVALSTFEKKYKDAFKDNTFALCWTFRRHNRAVLKKLVKDNAGGVVVEVQTYANALLRQFITESNRHSVAEYYLGRVRYVGKERIKKAVLDWMELSNPNLGLETHRNFLLILPSHFKKQREIRLLAEASTDDKKEKGALWRSVDFKDLIERVYVHGWCMRDVEDICDKLIGYDVWFRFGFVGIPSRVMKKLVRIFAIIS